MVQSRHCLRAVTGKGKVAPGMYLGAERSGRCDPRTQGHNAWWEPEAIPEPWALEDAGGVSRDCGDVCSVRESRTITLKVRRRTSAVGQVGIAATFVACMKGAGHH